MKVTLPFSARFFALAALFLTGTVAIPQALAQPSDKVVFSPPREATTAKPTAGSEAPERSRAVPRQEGSMISSEMPAGMNLPAPDDVNRARLLLSLIERRRDQNAGMDIGSGLPAKDGTVMGDDQGSRLTIDDLFEKSGLGANSRDKGTDSDRRREEARRHGDDSRSGEGDNGEGSRNRAGKDSRKDSRSGNGDSDFLPSMDARDRDFRRSIEGDIGRSAGAFLRGDPSSVTGMGAAKDREELSRSRGERSEIIRKLIGGSRSGTASGGDATGGYRSGSFDARGGVGSMGASPGGGSGKSISDAMSARANGTPTPLGENVLGGTADRSFAVPSRPLDFDSRSSRGSFNSVKEGTVEPMRPMQIFQQKHDTRIPTRAF